MKALTKKEMKRQMEALEVLSLEAKKEIVNFLKIESNILNDVNIRVSNYRVDINVCNYDVFILSKCWGDDIKYSTSIYSTTVDEGGDEEKKEKYRKVISIFSKILETGVCEQLKIILEKYRQLAIEIENINN